MADLVDVFLNEHERRTRETYRKIIRYFVAWHSGDPQCNEIGYPWATIRYTDMSEFHNYLSGKRVAQSSKGQYAKAQQKVLATNTRSLYMTVIKNLLRKGAIPHAGFSANQVVDAEVINGLSALKVKRDEDAVRGREILHEEEKVIMASIDISKPAGIRDFAIVRLLFNSGLRREELTGLAWDKSLLRLSQYDYQQYPSEFNLDKAQLEIRGKGQRKRDIPLTDNTIEPILEWLRIRGGESGPLFFAISKSGKVLKDRPLKETGLRHIISSLSKKVQAENIPPLSVHDFRRTFCTRLLRDNDPLLVQKLMGHSDISTTKRYDYRDEDDLAAAIERTFGHK